MKNSNKNYLPSMMVVLLLLTLSGFNAQAEFKTASIPKDVPELLLTANGEKVDSVEKWEKVRRGEILKTFKEEFYGIRPVERPADLKFTEIAPVEECFGGKAVRKRIKGQYSGPGGSSEFVFSVWIPKREHPVAVFVHSSPRPAETANDVNGPRPTYWLPAEEIISRGYAVVAYCNQEIALDWHLADVATNGVFKVFGNPKLTERKPTEWGILSAWAWGMSRIVDWIETEPLLDAKRIASVGLSRNGKTSLLAGATDERFAMVVSCCSGCGGAKLNHMGCNGAEYSKDLAHVVKWFAPNYLKYVGKDQSPEMKFDQHQLLALVAPRLLYVSSATEDAWAGPRGEFAAAVLASPAWELYGKTGLVHHGFPKADYPLHAGHVGYHLRTGLHDITKIDWQLYMDFADGHGWNQPRLKPKAPVEPHPDTPAYPWKPLFAKDLSDAEFEKGAWRWQGDVLYSVKETSIWTKADYENYVLDFEYAMEKDGNSGVFIYISNLDKFPKYKIEIQLLDDGSEKFKGKELPYQQSGSLYGRAPAVEIASKPAGEWNRMTAFCAGKNVHIILNGKVVVDANLDDWKNPLVNPDGTPVPPWHRGFPALSTIPTYGRVGFQGVHGEAGVRIRNLRIASLGKTTANNELKLACQLWTVKDLWSKKSDKIAAFSQIFPKLKAMGYDGVQSMAFIREDPSALEKLLKENNLVIADQPVGLHDIEDEAALQKTIAFCKRFGVDFIYVPWFSAKTAEQWRSFCKRLNAVEVKLKAHGIKVGYHNHIHELTEKVDGEYPWDILTGADGTRLEMDIGPVLEASKTPADEIMKMGSRIPSGIHAKAVGATAAGAIGEKHEWPKIVAAAKKAGVKWLVVECEKRQDIFDDAEASAKYLRPLVNLANEIK